MKGNKPKSYEENSFNSLLGSEIKLIRIARGISQGELGRYVGVSANMVSYYENGGGIPVSRLVKVAQFLDFSLGSVLREVEKNNAGVNCIGIGN